MAIREGGIGFGLIGFAFGMLIGFAFGMSAPEARGQDVLDAARQDVAVLAGPDMFGRGYAFDGHRRAAAYLQAQYRAIGLDSLAPGYLQPFPLVADLILETPRLAVNGRPLRPGLDFLPLSSTASGRAEGRIQDAGHGLYRPDRGIDEFGALQGRVVVFREALPEAVVADTTWPEALRSRSGRLGVATARGASAVIILVDRLIFDQAPDNAGIPVFMVRSGAWPVSAGAVAYAVHSLQDQRLRSQNVIGIVPGTARPDSTLLVTAHYDHLGALGTGVYFPGANDNASGVALLLALARHFKHRPARYTLVFVAFSGEEVGLVGSRYFAEHPVVDLSKTRFLLNFDMVASGKDGITVVGGLDFPAAYARLAGLHHGADRLRPRPNRPNSDHYFLLQRGVPGFYLFTTGGRQPYHHVDDRPATLEWDDFLHVYALSRRFLESL